MPYAAMTLGFTVGGALMSLFWQWFNRARDTERDALRATVSRHEERLDKIDATIAANFKEIRDSLQGIALTVSSLAGREQCVATHTGVAGEIAGLKTRVSVLETKVGV